MLGDGRSNVLPFYFSAVALRRMFLFGVHNSLEQPFLRQEIASSLPLFSISIFIGKTIFPNLRLRVGDVHFCGYITALVKNFYRAILL